MKKLLIRLVCAFFPMSFIAFLIRHKYKGSQHKFKPTDLIHRHNTILFEVEFNWYNEDLEPITIIRGVKNGKIGTIHRDEWIEWNVYLGKDRNAGSTF